MRPWRILLFLGLLVGLVVLFWFLDGPLLEGEPSASTVSPDGRWEASSASSFAGMYAAGCELSVCRRYLWGLWRSCHSPVEWHPSGNQELPCTTPASDGVFYPIAGPDYRDLTPPRQAPSPQEQQHQRQQHQ